MVAIELSRLSDLQSEIADDPAAAWAERVRIGPVVLALCRRWRTNGLSLGHLAPVGANFLAWFIVRQR